MTQEYDSPLTRRLRQLPVPPPSADFADRVFAAVRATQRPGVWRPAYLGYALAASLALGVGLAVWLDRSVPVSGTQAVVVASGGIEPVRLVFNSPRALAGVTIHLQLPDGVELAGRPGRRELSWQADLQAGANALELPVIVQRGEGGVVTASVSYGQDRRQFAVLVQARRPSALIPKPDAQRVAAVEAPCSASTEVDHA